MRRWIPLMLLAVVTLATACPPAPPPQPSDYQPPVVQSVVQDPPVATVGVPFRVTVVATDDELVRRVSISVGVQPNNEWNLDPVWCDDPTREPGWVPSRSVTVEFTCVAPPDALNGTWRGTLTVSDEWCLQCGTDEEIEFRVTGGVADLAPPTLELLQFTPSTIVAGEPFTVTVRTSDENHAPLQDHPVRRFRIVRFGSPLIEQLCEELSRRAISPTVYEYVHQCDANPALLPGSYQAEFLESFNDRFMNRLSPRVDLELVAGG